MPFQDVKHYSLWYEDNHGDGNNYLLLHNAGGDLSFLSPQFELLSKEGRVCALDYPDHGKSKSTMVKEINLRSITTVVNQFCRERELKNMTVIGLNYGANIALELFHQHPRLISKILLIDPPLLLSETVRKGIETHIVELDNIKQEEYANELISGSFIHAEDEVKQNACKVFSKMSPKVLKNIYTDLLAWDKNHACERLESLSVPSLCIGTDASLCDIRELERLNPLISTAQVVRSKYWATIEVPEQINAMIKRFCGIYK